MTDDDLLQLLHDTADAVADALGRVEDWGPSGMRDGQYAADLLAARALDRDDRLQAFDRLQLTRVNRLDSLGRFEHHLLALHRPESSHHGVAR